jgi:hypothetical protein
MTTTKCDKCGKTKNKQFWNFNKITNKILSIFLVIYLQGIALLNLFLGLLLALVNNNLVMAVETVGVASLYILAAMFLIKRKSYAFLFTKIILSISIFIIIIGYILDTSLLIPTIISLIMYGLPRVFFLDKSIITEIYGEPKEEEEGYSIFSIFAIIYALITPFHAVVFSIYSFIHLFKNPRLKGRVITFIALVISCSLIFYLYLLPFGGL